MKLNKPVWAAKMRSMPFSNFIYKGQWLEIRDSRLEQIIGLCRKLFPEFIQSQNNREQLAWLDDAINDWMEERELPPGCKILRLDALLTSSDRRVTLGRFFAFVSSKIRYTMPTTDTIVATECERVQQFVESTISRIWSEEQTA